MADLKLTMREISRVLSEETGGLHPRLILLTLRAQLLGNGGAPAKYAALLRSAGFVVGHGTRVRGLPRITGSRRGAHDGTSRGLFANLVIGAECTVDRGVTFDLEERITIGDDVILGPQVMILTSTHEIGPREHRAGVVVRRPVTIGSGASIGARSVILPGVTIGDGAIVTANSVVNKDVPAHTLVGGIPARRVDATAQSRSA